MNYKQIIESLNSQNPEEIIDSLQQLNDAALTDDLVDAVNTLILHNDKGVRNFAAQILSFSDNPKVPYTLVKFIHHPDLTIKNLAGEILLNLNEKSIEALLSFINKGDDDDKKFIIDILGLIGSKESEKKILEVLKASENDNLTLACIESLGNIGSENAIENLISLYPQNELFKPSVIEALGKIKSQKSLDFLMEKYSIADDLIKITIIESLGEVGDIETFFFLLSELNENSGPFIWIIINSLYQLKQKNNLDIPFDERMKSAILYTITEGELKFKKNAINLINDFNDPEIVNSCLEIFGIDQEIDEILSPKFFANYEVIFSSIYQTISSNPPNLNSILNLFREMLFMNIDIGLNFFSDIKLRNLSDALIKCLKDPDEEIRIISFEILNLLDEKTASLFTDLIAEDASYWNRLRMVDIISKNSFGNVDEILLKMSNDEEEMVKERANYYLSIRKQTL